ELERQVDLRIVAAAQDDIFETLRDGRFRNDLFQRIAGVIIRLSPLSKRPEDTVLLAEYFAGLGGRRLEAGVDQVLRGHSWPGNVRELRMAIERAGALVANGTLPSQAVAEAIDLCNSEVSQGGKGVQTVVGFQRERSELLRACKSHGWDADRVARAMGIHRATLFRRLKRAGISLRAPQSQSRT